MALVGTNIGAGQRARALRIALIGGAIAFAVTEAIGLAAAIWPQRLARRCSAPIRAWSRPGAPISRIVGPTYGFFGLGLALYFASQGAGRLFWPLSAGFLRLVIAIGGGWLALRVTGSLRLAVRRACARPRRLWSDRARGGRLRRLVQGARPRPSSNWP